MKIKCIDNFQAHNELTLGGFYDVLHTHPTCYVIINDMGISSRKAVLFVKQNDGYKMVDTEGNTLSESVFEDAKQQHHALTESCCAMLMFNLGYDINFIEGSVNNIKIIRDEDIAVFGALLEE